MASNTNRYNRKRAANADELRRGAQEHSPVIPFYQGRAVDEAASR